MPTTPKPAESVQNQDLTQYSQVDIEWNKRFSTKTILFYIYPLISRWLKAFKTPSVLIISDVPIDLALWEKRFKASSIKWMILADAFDSAKVSKEYWDLVIVLKKNLEKHHVDQIAPLIKKGGTWISITQNLFKSRKNWEALLEEQEIVQFFPVGFHPRGAIAWWPFIMVGLCQLGQFLDAISVFFPGRYELSLRWGRCWLIRGIKRDDVTLLT